MTGKVRVPSGHDGPSPFSQNNTAILRFTIFGVTPRQALPEVADLSHYPRLNRRRV